MTHRKRPENSPQTEIEDIISSFGDAASRCAKAGFDGIELHGAHGYLICQFLGEKANRRKDEWGGEILNRSRFLMRIIDDVRDKVPEDFIIGVKDISRTQKGRDSAQ